jgi:hypothetical protein
MKARPEMQLRTFAEQRELVPREQPRVDPVVLSAVWGGKKSGQSKPPGWASSTTSSTAGSTLMTNSPVWQASTRY